MTQNNDKKPWEQTFNNATDSKGHLSRTELRKQNHNNSLITVILVTIIILIAIVSLAWGVTKGSSSNSSKVSDNDTTKITNDSMSHVKVNNTHKKSKSKNNVIHKKNSNSVQSSVSKLANKNNDSSSSNDENSSINNNVHNNSHHSNAQENNETYVTVGAGQGVYRVATNAGISMSQLLQLNGLNQNSSIHPGEKLRIK